MEKEFIKLGYTGTEVGHTRWCENMTGREFGRINSWGSGAKRGVRMLQRHGNNSQSENVNLSLISIGRLSAAQSMRPLGAPTDCGGANFAAIRHPTRFPLSVPYSIHLIR